MLSRLLLWLLFIGLTPAGPELVEWVTHYVQEGDFADAPDHGRPAEQQTEHGCAVLCHSCSCHGPTASQRRSTGIANPQVSSRLSWPAPAVFVPAVRPAPPTPPPIA